MTHAERELLPTPLTDALISEGPFTGPKEWIDLWDKAIDSHRSLERKLAALTPARDEGVTVPQETKCTHCNAVIKHFSGRLWHDESPVFPQYCATTKDNRGRQLHEPAATAPQPEGRE